MLNRFEIPKHQAIEKNEKIKEIDFFTGFGDKGAIALASALEKNHTLKSIEFSYTTISNKGAIALAEALKKNYTVTKITLGHTLMDEKSAIAFAQALEHNQTIKKISFRYNKIGDKGAVALAKALENNHVLEVIDLKDCDIGEKGAMAFAKLLQKNKTIFVIISLLNTDVIDRVKIYLDGNSRLLIKEHENSIIQETIDLSAVSKGASSVLRLGMQMYAKINRNNFSSKGTYTPNNFQLNPFTFFSEHADREEALFLAQKHQKRLNLDLEKYLELWETYKIDGDSQKKSLALQQVAYAFGFKCSPIAKDGNCLFEAIAQKLKEIFPQQNTYHYSHTKLRELAVNYLMKHQDFYENFVEDHSFESFIGKMGMSGTWAEHTVLNALAHVLNITFVVINSDNSPPIILKKPHAQGIIYLGYEVNAHYQLLTHDLSIMPEKNIQSYIDHSNFIEEPKEASVEQLRVEIRK